VLDYDEDSEMATLEVRNNFRGNITAEVFGPHITATRFTLQELYDLDGNLMEVARTPMQKIKTHIPIRLEKDAMIRKVVERDRSGIY
ncbi:MAG: U32 family peptidase C-terminal domain-containing protein, partial [Clostridium sp.]|nr:U32 family peptidase C-terminal domain-containing protein [Clostridium sp.]